MNESTNHDSSLVPSEADLEQLLGDAYDVPELPRSLLLRIDRQVQAEWGVSPRLASSTATRYGEAVARGARAVRPLAVAAAITLFAVFLFMVNGDSTAYAWSKLTDALEKQGVVQILGPDRTRWLALADGLLSERTADSYRLIDIRNNELLERTAGDAPVHRQRLQTSTGGRDALVLAFLLDESTADADWQKLGRARLVDQDWERTTVNGKTAVQLRVQFQIDKDQDFSLAFTLDPESHLPTAFKVVGDDEAVASPLPLTYPMKSATALREQDFPTELLVAAAGQAEKNPPAEKEKSTVKAELPEQEDAQQAVVKAAARVAGDEHKLLGAPSAWKPVDVSDRSTEQVVQQVDEVLAQLWEEHGVTPAEDAQDEELLRRVYLDLAGRTPSVHEVRTYLADKSPNRYENLVDRLLASPDHASHIATVWRTFLIPEGIDLTRFGGVEAFDKWLAKQLADNVSYDQIARELLLAEGRLVQSGPLLFYSALKLDPDQLASRTARVFLGLRLDCAQCHDHPFEPWTQKDFWGFAAFFAQISRPKAKLESVSTVMRVQDVDRGEVTLPESDSVIEPKVLGGETPDAGQQEASRRELLAQWLTSAENPYFARAAVNRVWGHMFGKGIVDPVDEFGIQNKPKSPELLDMLAGHFIHSEFSLQEVFRAIALSHAYRLSSAAAKPDPARTEWFAQMHVKTLTAEQIFDCITVATLLDNPAPANFARFGNTSRAEFLQRFRTPAGRTTEYLAGIPQALTLMNGTLTDGATGINTSGLLKSLEAPFFTNSQRIEVLYLATLSRRPRPAESQLLQEYIPEDASGAHLQEALADVLWALLNSAEFSMNH